MDNTRPEKKPPPLSRASILELFVTYRRPLLVLVLLITLEVVWSSLSPRAQEAIYVSLLAQRGLLALLSFFSIIALSLLWSSGQRLDANLFLYFNLHRRRSLWIDRFMWGATQIGNGLFAFLLAGVFFLLGYRHLAIELALGILTLWLFVEVIKALTDRARPYVLMTEVKIVGWRERGKSFPSGHTSQTFFLMSLLIHYFHLSLGISMFFYIVAALVAFTRVYVGAHYPRDVLGGALLGTVWGILAVLIDPFLVRRLF